MPPRECEAVRSSYDTGLGLDELRASGRNEWPLSPLLETGNRETGFWEAPELGDLVPLHTHSLLSQDLGNLLCE